MTGGAGVDVSIELSGVYPALHTAIRATRYGGKVCMASVIRGNTADLWLGREFLANSLTMFVPRECQRSNAAREYKPSDYPLWDQFRIYDSLVCRSFINV